MVSTYAQKKASKTYIDKLKSKGISQHGVYCSDLQWLILKELIKVVKNLDLDALKSLEIDDDGKFIRFIYENQPETRVVSSNSVEDDKWQPKTKQRSVRAKKQGVFDMNKKPWEMIEILEQIAKENNLFVTGIIKIIVYALEDVLSLNDFNTLKERLKEDIKNGADEKDS